MIRLKYISIFLLLTLYSCAQNKVKQKINPEAVRLNNKIVDLSRYLHEVDSCKKALVYLDSATVIDTNYYLGYYNKLMFLYSLKQFDEAISTVNNCIRIKPNSNDLYLTGGILYEKIGDTISSRKYFQKSLEIINPILDTMKSGSINHELLVFNKAVNLIMLGNNKIGQQLLKSIYSSQNEKEKKEMIFLYLNKSKEEIIELMTKN